MLKIVMIYDQVQAGLGTKSDDTLPLGAQNIPIGPSVMMERFFKEYNEKVIACFYCGTGTYLNSRQEISKKICNKIEQIKPDAVICGPSFDYKDYSRMCAELAYDIIRTTLVPAFAFMASVNDETISNYKDKIFIVKCPKKGDAQLNKCLRNACRIAEMLGTGKEPDKSDECIY